MVGPKYLIVFLITLVLVVGEARYNILGGYDRLATTLGICIGTEVVLSWWLRGRVANIASAYITGISLALLTKPQANILWPFALGAFLAIGSKYVLTYRGRHLWNPSNFAIALLVLVASDSVAILSPSVGQRPPHQPDHLGLRLAVAWRARVLHVTLTYVACFVLLAALRNAMVGGPAARRAGADHRADVPVVRVLHGYGPAHHGQHAARRMLVVAIVALVETIIRLGGDFQVALLRPFYPSPHPRAGDRGPIAMWWDLYRQGRKATRP